MAQHGGAVRLRDALPVIIAFLLATVLMAPALAGAMSVDKTTAKSNQETSGNSIYSGTPTRVTWEGTVGDAEEVSSIDIAFPEGTVFSSESYAKLTVLSGIDRIETDGTSSIEGLSVHMEFPTPLAAGTLLRVEIYEVSLPAGDIMLSGSYSTTSGTTSDFDEGPIISVVQQGAADGIVAWLDGQAWVEKWNSVPFLRTFFKPQLIASTIPSIFWGWLRALGLVACGFPLAIPLGLILALLKMGKIPVIKQLANIYINVVRGTPLFLQIYIAYFGLPLLGLNLNNYLVGIVVLAMNSSAYLAEIFRAGIQSIHKGQFEAAASLGMNSFQTMFSVIIPQTVRRVIPTMTSEFILLYKDTSLLSAVGVMELMMFSKSLVATSGNITPYIVAAGYYLLVTLPLIKFVNVLERKLGVGDGSQGGQTTKRRKRFGKKKEEKPTWKPDADEPIELDATTHGSY